MTPPAIAGLRTDILADPANPQLLVQVVDTDGCTGVGETWWGTYQPAAPAGAPVQAIATLIDTILAPLCTGAPIVALADIAGLRERLVRATAQYGPEGITSIAISGIDLALWDLLATRLGKPVADLLGARRATPPRAYASLHWLNDVGAIVTAARSAVDAGFDAVKLHEADPALIRDVRAELEPDLAVMVDVSGRWDETEALSAIETLADQRLTWIEEPTYPYNDYQQLHRVHNAAAAAGISLAAGENEFSVAGFERLSESGAVDVIQPDLAKCGGLTTATDIARVANVHAITLAPHNFSLGPSLLANIAWAAVTTTVEWVEVPWLGENRTFPSGMGVPRLVDGCILPPDAAGLGFAGARPS